MIHLLLSTSKDKAATASVRHNLHIHVLIYDQKFLKPIKYNNTNLALQSNICLTNNSKNIVPTNQYHSTLKICVHDKGVWKMCL